MNIGLGGKTGYRGSGISERRSVILSTPQDGGPTTPTPASCKGYSGAAKKDPGVLHSATSRKHSSRLDRSALALFTIFTPSKHHSMSRQNDHSPPQHHNIDKAYTALSVLSLSSPISYTHSSAFRALIVTIDLSVVRYEGGAARHPICNACVLCSVA